MAYQRSYFTSRRASVTCPGCNALFEGLGQSVELETVSCADDECIALLCPCCPQFVCICCGLVFCAQHVGQEIDPECSCIQTDVDQFDATYCEAHGGRNSQTLLLCRQCVAPEQLIAGVEPITDFSQITETVLMIGI